MRQFDFKAMAGAAVAGASCWLFGKGRTASGNSDEEREPGHDDGQEHAIEVADHDRTGHAGGKDAILNATPGIELATWAFSTLAH